jgi:malonyl-CoA/methylmalonyl-CoA synthetase
LPPDSKLGQGNAVSRNLFFELASRFPEPGAPFIVLPDGETFTYGDLEAWSARLAHGLIAMGIDQGDRVAVQAPKSPQFLFLYLACLRAGAVLLPLNTDYTPREVSYFLRNAGARLLVCAPGRAADLAAIAAEAGVERVVTLGEHGEGSLIDAAREAPERFETAAVGGDDLAAILYTSGTTGVSKGAMLSHENLASNARVLVDCWRFTRTDVLLHPLPIYHTHGLFVATNVCLMAGCSMLFMPRFSGPEAVRLLPGASTMMGVPTHYHRLLAEPAFDADLVRHMRLFISGSAPLSAESHRAFEACSGHRILERYGMTETNMITSNPYDGERRAGTVGLPLPEVEVRIAEIEGGRILPQGEIGVIEVRGPNVFKGYWRMPEKTAQEFRSDRFFITGDMGLIDADGYVSIVGREKDLVISGGLNVYPAEIEALLDALPGVRESAVIGLPHPDFGEAVTAVVAGEAIDEAEIRGKLAKDLAAFKVPKRVLRVSELPRNAMGKIQKKVLREIYAGLYS